MSPGKQFILRFYKILRVQFSSRRSISAGGAFKKHYRSLSNGEILIKIDLPA